MVKKKAKTKDWYIIILPKVFGEREIGTTFATEPKFLLGRKVYASAMEISNNMNKYYMKFSFKITKIEGNKAFTEFDGSQCLQDYISRMIVRRVRRIDVVQDLMTKDKLKVRIKGLATVSRKAKSSIQGGIRDKIREILKQEVESITIDELATKILSDEIKTKILTEVRKIYPIRNFEIRKTEVIAAKGMELKS